MAWLPRTFAAVSLTLLVVDLLRSVSPVASYTKLTPHLGSILLAVVEYGFSLRVRVPVTDENRIAEIRRGKTTGEKSMRVVEQLDHSYSNESVDSTVMKKRYKY